MICQRLDTWSVSPFPFYLIRQPTAIWIKPPLSEGPMYKVLTVPFYGKGNPLTIFKIVGMTRTRTKDLPIKIQIYYYEPNLLKVKGSIIRNVQNTGSWGNTVLASRRVPIVDWVPRSLLYYLCLYKICIKSTPY